MPRIDERRTKIPKIKETPNKVSPHSFTKFIIGKTPGFKNHWKSPGKVFAPFKYPSADHEEFKTLVIPA